MSDIAVADVVLALDEIEKRFGNVTALSHASFALRRGTVHALLGENGAGKTTLMRIAFGMLRADSGVVRVNGTPRRFASPADAIALGIGMVHQHFSLVPALTVAENVALGGRGRFGARAAEALVARIAAESGLAVDPRARVESLGVGEQQRVEIVKALAHDATVLVLDEPTAVLAPDAARELLAWLRRFAAGGGSAVLITHKLRDALEVADDITVLRRGRTTLARSTHGATEQDLLDAMLGHDAAPAHLASVGASATFAADARATADHTARRSPPIFSLRDARVVDARGVTTLAGATLDIHGGEIVGIAAVEGSGQQELLRLLAGRLEATSGSVTRPESVGFVPEDRQHDALIADFDLVENIALRGAGERRGRMAWRGEADRARRVIASFNVVASSERASAASLSGGNQQKLVLGRELDGAPAAIVAENPTRGLDVRASAAVLEKLRDARNAGVAVVVYSADLDEVLSLADRVLVVHGGSVREAPRDRETVGRLMLGG